MCKKPSIVLQDKSGASLIFVLCITMLLVILGTSALFAASTASGGGIHKRETQQRDLYLDSIAQAFTAALQTPPSNSTLGGQMLRAIYNWGIYTGTGTPPTLPEEFDMGMNGLSSDVAYTITAEFQPEPSVVITEPIPEIVDESNNVVSPREPMTVTINAKMTVTFTVTFAGKSSRAVATYSFINGYLEDINKPPYTMEVKNWGEWRLDKYGKVEINEIP